SRFSDDVIFELISTKPGNELDVDQLEYDLSKIYGLGFIRMARYSVVQNDDKQGVKFTISQNERGTQLIETGMDLGIDSRGTNFNFRAAYLNTSMDNRGSELRALLQFGEVPGLFVDFYKRLDDRLRFTFEPSFSVFRRPLYIFNNQGDAIAEITLDEVGAAIGFGWEFNRHLKASSGFSRYKGKMDITVGAPSLTPFSFDGAEVFAALNYDSLDDAYFPTRGTLASLKYTTSLQALGADVQFEQLEFSFVNSHTFGLHNLFWGGQFNTSLDENLSIYSWYTAGGFLNMSGFEPNSLIGPNYGQLLLGYRYRIGKSGIMPGYIGTTLEYGNVTQNRKDVFGEGLLNGSVYLAYSSPLGPIYVGVGWSEQRSALLFLRMGAIFGPRSLGRR
ncbi:MAG: BamA/TamA family outer membrane protein, partial [Candidatus Marinimicrobia bacterium]|nr:BamA/TamA family outer membrane protein [Candidatus Neomarinimicrobiota bacterium]